MTATNETSRGTQTLVSILGASVVLGALLAARWLEWANLVADVPLFHLVQTGLVVTASLCVVSALGAALPHYVLLWLSPRPGPWRRVLVPAGATLVIWTAAVLHYGPAIMPFAPWYLFVGLVVASAAAVVASERVGTLPSLPQFPVAIGGPVLLTLGLLLLLPAHSHRVMPRFVFPRWVASRDLADSTCQGGRVWEPVLASTSPPAANGCQSLYLLMNDEEDMVFALEQVAGSCPLEPAPVPVDPGELEWMMIRREALPATVVTMSNDFAPRACGVAAGSGS